MKWLLAIGVASVMYGSVQAVEPLDEDAMEDLHLRGLDAPAAGELNLRIEIPEGASNVENDAPVVAGTYVDTVRIFLEPR